MTYQEKNQAIEFQPPDFLYIYVYFITYLFSVIASSQSNAQHYKKQWRT